MFKKLQLAPLAQHDQGRWCFAFATSDVSGLSGPKSRELVSSLFSLLRRIFRFVGFGVAADGRMINLNLLFIRTDTQCFL